MIKRRWRFGGVAVLIGGCVALGLTTVAGGSTANRRGRLPAAPAASTTVLTFPTLIDAHAGDGVPTRLGVTIEGCGSPHGSLGLLYGQRFGAAQAEHDYEGHFSECRLASSLSAGSVAARWGSSVRLKLRLAAVGRPRVVRQRISHDCFDTLTSVEYRAKGQLDADIHADSLGRFASRYLTVQLQRYVFPACPGTGGESQSEIFTYGPSLFPVGPVPAPNGPQLAAFWRARDNVFAFTSRRSSSGIELSEPVGDAPMRGVSDQFSLQVEAGNPFFAATDLKHARLNFETSISTGMLSFAGRRACGNRHAFLGRLTGRVRVDDPGVRPLILTGAEMGTAVLSRAEPRNASCTTG